MFCRDPIVLLNSLLTPTVRYLGTNENILTLAALKNMYQLIANNLEQGQKKRDTKAPIPDGKLSDGDSVLPKNHTARMWDPKYTRDYQIVSFPGKTQAKVVDSKDKVKIVHIFRC